MRDFRIAKPRVRPEPPNSQTASLFQWARKSSRLPTKTTTCSRSLGGANEMSCAAAGPHVDRKPCIRPKQRLRTEYGWDRGGSWEERRLNGRDVQGLIPALGLVREGWDPSHQVSAVIGSMGRVCQIRQYRGDIWRPCRARR